MLKYGHESGKCATRGSKTVKVAQFASGSRAPAKNAAMPTISNQCGRRWRIDCQPRYPKNPTVRTADVVLVTSGQLVTPRNGGKGPTLGFAFVVRGSPCSPVCIVTKAMIANAMKTRAAVAHPSRHDRRRLSVAV